MFESSIERFKSFGGVKEHEANRHFLELQPGDEVEIITNANNTETTYRIVKQTQGLTIYKKTPDMPEEQLLGPAGSFKSLRVEDSTLLIDEDPHYGKVLRIDNQPLESNSYLDRRAA